MPQTPRKRGRPRSTGADQLVPMGFRLSSLTRDRIAAIQLRCYQTSGKKIAMYQVIEKAVDVMCYYCDLPSSFQLIRKLKKK